MDAEHLFVYGTLRPGSGHPQAKFLAEHGRHVGAARMAGKLHNLGRYPGLVAAETADDWVRGDLMLIGDGCILQRLDEYEGAAFQRKLGTAWTETGNAVNAWYYEFQRPVRAESRIASGDYLAR